MTDRRREKWRNGAGRPRRDAVGFAAHVRPAGWGFTLIEVLAGLVLVAIVLPVAVRAIQVGLGASDMTRQRLEAVSLAQSKLDELVATGEWDRAEARGPFDDPFERYAFAVDLADFDDTVRALTVTVSWQRRGREQAVRLATLVDTSEE